MKQYNIHQGLFIIPTPAGAYYCVSSREKTPARQLLHVLLSQKSTPSMTLEKIQQWLKIEDKNEALEVIYRSQELGWIGGIESPVSAPGGTLEDILPELLSGLSDKNEALLADSQGFYICAQGFPHETAEEVSALSADLAIMHERHQLLIQRNLGLDTSAWSLVDAAGNSQMGFWPMYIGEQRFVLVISGFPHLNQPELVSLIWTLYHRYGNLSNETGFI